MLKIHAGSPMDPHSLRGFSAGLLYILWPVLGVVTKGRLGAIACPPALLTMGPAKEGDELYLVH